MDSSFSALTISYRELEHLTALEVGPDFAANTYRPSALLRPQGPIKFCAMQVVAGGLAAMLTILPVSFSLNHSPQRNRLLPLAWGALTALVWSGGNGWLYLGQRRRERLLRLLDEVDRFNRVVESALLWQQLVQVEAPAPAVADLTSALQLVRRSLIAGLQIDRLLRSTPGAPGTLPETWGQELIASWTQLQQIMAGSTAQDYGDLLALVNEIGRELYQELGGSSGPEEG